MQLYWFIASYTHRMKSAYDLVADDFSAVDAMIIDQLQSDVTLVEDISQYLVKGGGKRIRPLVTLLVAGALGDANNPDQVKLACAIEFLHTATLLHDDVVDMSALRRGQPTANANWGNASSVLVGDFVYSKSFQLLVGIGQLDVMEILSRTTTRIAEGEVKQLSVIGNTELGEQDYFTIINAKTAELFAGACESSAVIANAPARQAMHDYGHHLGLAFQLVDDYLDYSGDSETMGKNLGDDLAEGKLTLPLIRALQVCAEQDPQARLMLLDIISAKDTARIGEALAIIEAADSLAYTRLRAEQHAGQARECLAGVPDSPYKEQLAGLSEFVTSRSR